MLATFRLDYGSLYLVTAERVSMQIYDFGPEFQNESIVLSYLLTFRACCMFASQDMPEREMQVVACVMQWRRQPVSHSPLR